jgi:hypothetical protein
MQINKTNIMLAKNPPESPFAMGDFTPFLKGIFNFPCKNFPFSKAVEVI